MARQSNRHPACQFQTDKIWLYPQYHSDGTIMKPDELEKGMEDPPNDIDYDEKLNRIQGSMIGMALGDALGAFVEFRPHEYMVANPVTTLKGGGTWGLKKGQFTDDTSMGLCLANSLVARQNYVPYDQLVRYNWWHKKGYMSSTGSCFDIGSATKQSLVKFEQRQKRFAEEHKIPFEQMDSLLDPDLLNEFNVYCSKDDVAGNGALMRLAPVPLFFYRDPIYAVKYSGHSGKITHGDQKAYDACRYYGALIVAAVNGESRDDLLDIHFYEKHKLWFGNEPLHPDIMNIAHGSYQKEEGYAAGIRGKGYIVSALEAALWAFWSEEKSFREGALAAVNLGDDTDTTAAIYGQLAGAYYGYRKLRKDWADQVFAQGFIRCLSKWIAYEGAKWSQGRPTTLRRSTITVEPPSIVGGVSFFEQKTNSSAQPVSENKSHRSKLTIEEPDTQSNSLSKFRQQLSPGTIDRPRRNTVCNYNYNRKPDVDQQSASTRSASAKQPQPIFFTESFATCQAVCKWIGNLGTEYVPYVQFFREHDVTGYWLLNHITGEMLESYGIENPAHRKFILAKIKQLRKESVVTFVTDKS